MSFAFPLKVGVDIVLGLEETAATAFALALVVVALEAPEVAAELAHGLVGEAAPCALGSPICHKDGIDSILLGHLCCVRSADIFLATVG